MTAPAPRLLFVGDDAAWCGAARAAAAGLRREIDCFGNAEAALDHILRAPAPPYSHLIAAPGTGRLVPAIAELIGEWRALPYLVELERDGAPAAGIIADAVGGTASATPDEASPPLAAEELRALLYEGCLRARFQPQISLATGEVCAVEALARLHHPDRGVLYPREFIPLATEWTLDRVLTGIVAANATLELAAAGLPEEIDISVNVPVTTVLREDATDRSMALLGVSGGNPERIVIEVLETPIAPDLAALGRAVGAFRARGFRVAVDDAGPALPHWRALLDLPFSVVKIDPVLADPSREAEAAEIVEAAKQRGMWVVMEGVADEPTLHRARALGVDAVQGFLFAYPMPARILSRWLDMHAARTPRRTRAPDA